MTTVYSGPERVVLTTERAKKLAFDMVHKGDPFSTEISPSLLSAHDIDRYILRTGLISPYHRGGGRKDRLKKASYEGRIGKSAWLYDPKSDKLTDCWNNERLIVPANTIVFVESDLEFRLPYYIALRFNLQIRHVHRGLLLGTGPLVDPGFWGKLCIPLHNLTNEPYEIPLSEGLIWVEFTKTTASDKDEGRPALDDNKPDNPDYGFWDTKSFITKAAQPFDSSKPSIAIRSSIPIIAERTRIDAEKAANEAKQAKDEAAGSRKASDEAKASAEQVKSRVESYGIIALLVSITTAVTFWASFYFGLRADMAALSSRVDTAVSSTRNSGSSNIGSRLQPTTEEQLRSDVEQLRRRLDQVSRENNALRRRLSNRTGDVEPQ